MESSGLVKKEQQKQAAIAQDQEKKLLIDKAIEPKLFQYKADKGRFPKSLDELYQSGYIDDKTQEKRDRYNIVYQTNAKGSEFVIYVRLALPRDADKPYYVVAPETKMYGKEASLEEIRDALSLFEASSSAVLGVQFQELFLDLLK